MIRCQNSPVGYAVRTLRPSVPAPINDLLPDHRGGFILDFFNEIDRGLEVGDLVLDALEVDLPILVFELLGVGMIERGQVLVGRVPFHGTTQGLIVVFQFAEVGGLSPRARGNLGRDLVQELGQGPIPAGAGEPGRRSAWRGRGAAYPRGRGGTRHQRSRILHPQGLSPRARGNLDVQRTDRGVTGPIPAGAGEPTAGGLS